MLYKNIFHKNHFFLPPGAVAPLGTPLNKLNYVKWRNCNNSSTSKFQSCNQIVTPIFLLLKVSPIIPLSMVWSSQKQKTQSFLIFVVNILMCAVSVHSAQVYKIFSRNRTQKILLTKKQQRFFRTTDECLSRTCKRQCVAATWAPSSSNGV